MPTPNSTRFEVAVYSEPEQTGHMHILFQDSSDNCLQLDIERLVGLHLAALSGDATAAENLRQLRRYARTVDHGPDIAEVYVEAHS